MAMRASERPTDSSRAFAATLAIALLLAPLPSGFTPIAFAQPDLDALETQLPPDDFAAAKEAAATADLEELVARVRRDLDS